MVFFGGSLLLIYVMLPPIEYLPSGKRNRIYGSLYPPPGYSVDKLMRLGRKFHDRLRPFAEVDPNSPEAEKLAYPVISDLMYGAYSGSIWLGARTADPTRTAELLPLMRQIAKEIAEENPGVESSINQAGLFQSGYNSASRSIDIDIRGPELDQLVAFGKRIRDSVRQQIPGAYVNARPTAMLGSVNVGKTTLRNGRREKLPYFASS